jgi:hypothetical protein
VDQRQKSRDAVDADFEDSAKRLTQIFKVILC